MVISFEDRMFGRFAMSDRDARVYYRTINATLKGAKRRNRRIRAFVSKSLRQGRTEIALNAASEYLHRTGQYPSDRP